MDDTQKPGRPGPGDESDAAGPDPVAEGTPGVTPPPSGPPPCAPPPPPYAPPPPPYAGAPAQRRLTRGHDRIIAGVASGLAHHLGVDVLLVRTAFAVLSFMGGVGFLLYIAGWLAIPAESEPEALGVTLLRRLGHGGWRAYLAVVLGAIALAALAGDLQPGHPGLVWGLLLLGFGVALLIRESDLRGPAGPPSATGGATPPPPPSTWTPSAPQSWTRPPPPAWSAAPPPRRGRMRRRSPVTRITLAVALLAAAAAGILGNAGVPGVDAQVVLAVALTVLGLGLVAGAWWGGGRGLILAGAALVPLVLAAGLTDVSLRGGAGDRLYEPRTVGQLGGAYHLAAGQLTIDLTRVPFGQSPSAVHADVGMGELDVILPADVPVDIRARVGAGNVMLLDHMDDGLHVDTTVHSDGSSQVGRLTLDLSAGLGTVNVRRADSVTQGASS